MKIDWSKPAQSVYGEPADVFRDAAGELRKDRDGNVMVFCNEWFYSLDDDGCNPCDGSRYLRNVPPEPIRLLVNVWRWEGGEYGISVAPACPAPRTGREIIAVDHEIEIPVGAGK